MHNGDTASKGFVICIVLFCAYMQWSPVVDFDYVWINGHEHYVGAANARQITGNAVVPIVLLPLRTHLQDSVPYLLPLPVEQSTACLGPVPTLRL